MSGVLGQKKVKGRMADVGKIWGFFKRLSSEFARAGGQGTASDLEAAANHRARRFDA
jgi:hypothetical protein